MLSVFILIKERSRVVKVENEWIKDIHMTYYSPRVNIYKIYFEQSNNCKTNIFLVQSSFFPKSLYTPITTLISLFSRYSHMI